MAKINYLRSLIASLEPEQLKTLVEDYAHQDKNFEAFVLEKSGKVIDTGKTYLEYHEELSAVLKKCKTKRGFVKVMRLSNAGMGSFYKLLQSHFKNENFSTALWMSLALIEMLHEAILMNTRYSSMQKPFKTFEAILLECRDIFDTCYKLAKPSRQQRKDLFEALIRCWWRERERSYEHRYFDAEDFFRYAERDEDLMTLQLALQTIKPRAEELDKKDKQRISAWEKMSGYFMPGSESGKTETKSRLQSIDIIEQKIRTALNSWE